MTKEARERYEFRKMKQRAAFYFEQSKQLSKDNDQLKKDKSDLQKEVDDLKKPKDVNQPLPSL